MKKKKIVCFSNSKVTIYTRYTVPLCNARASTIRRRHCNHTCVLQQRRLPLTRSKSSRSRRLDLRAQHSKCHRIMAPTINNYHLNRIVRIQPITSLGTRAANTFGNVIQYNIVMISRWDSFTDTRRVWGAKNPPLKALGLEKIAVVHKRQKINFLTTYNQFYKKKWSGHLFFGIINAIFIVNHVNSIVHRFLGTTSTVMEDGSSISAVYWINNVKKAFIYNYILEEVGTPKIVRTGVP